MATELTDRQRAIFGFVRDFIAETGYPPSHRDIVEGANISSTSVVAYNLRRLRDHGLIELSVLGEGRALRILDGGDERYVIRIPLAGWMYSDQPLPAPGDASDWPFVAITQAQLGGAQRLDAFAVRVAGWEFVDASLAHEDMLILDRGGGSIVGDGMYVTWCSRTGTEIVAGRHIGSSRAVRARLRGVVRVMVASG